MKPPIRLTLAILALMAASPMAHAFSPEPDLMQIKGYSPDLIKYTETQRSRQEWKAPAPPTLSPMERFFHNIFYNEWTGSMDDFGSQVLRDK